jgi:hypothetical protein
MDNCTYSCRLQLFDLTEEFESNDDNAYANAVMLPDIV